MVSLLRLIAFMCCGHGLCHSAHDAPDGLPVGQLEISGLLQAPSGAMSL